MQDETFLHYLNMTDEELLKVSLIEFKNRRCESIVYLRLTQISRTPIDGEPDVSRMTMGDLVLLSGKSLGTILNQIPKECLVLIQSNQLRTMDFSKANFDMMQWMFASRMNLATRTDRFAAIPKDQLHHLAKANKINITLLSLISVDQMQEFCFELLTDPTYLNKWFTEIVKIRGADTAEKLFAEVPDAHVQFGYSCLEGQVVYLPSEKQRRALDLRQFDDKVLNRLDLSSFTDAQVISIVHRLDCVVLGRVAEIVNKIDWTNVTSEQLRKGFEKFPHDAPMFFKNISKEKLDTLIPKLGVYLLIYASDEQLKNADYSSIDGNDLIDSIVGDKSMDTRLKRQLFHRLPEKIRTQIVDLNKKKHLHLLNDDELGAAAIPLEGLKEYFNPPYTLETYQELQARFDLLSPLQIQPYISTLITYNYFAQYPTEKFQQLTLQPANINPNASQHLDKVVSKLSCSQLTSIVEKLPKDTRKKLTPQQLQGIDFTEMNAKFLCEWFGDWYDRQLEVLKPSQVQQIARKLDLKSLKRLSKEQVLAIDFTGFDSEILNAWFIEASSLPREHLHEFSSAQLKIIVPNLNFASLGRIADNKQAVDLSAMTTQQMEDLATKCSCKKVFTLFRWAGKNVADYEFRPEQIRGMFDEDKHEQESDTVTKKSLFSQLPIARIQPLLTVPQPHLLKYMADDLLFALDFSELTLDQLKGWFLPQQYSDYRILQVTTFKKLKREQLQPILTKFDIKMLLMIQKQQVKQLDVSCVKEDLLKEWKQKDTYVFSK